ncbi:ribonuclease J [Tengunoibacter tsumagoiensis]|uniref:Ribonuclease J n=1 Tax=Tengunoibacter tsumagoiensis TaxID=2014871 RepID=A0A401ZU46_9CHLR|nr:ribonuclease J [Tengunoibacter tsumagoiensis]GCE10419.1 ribonuclease J [Tengunoibacter tsumagoiensis]
MTTGKIRLVPLGGLGEVGKNMMVVEYGDDIIIIDVGVMFPDEEMFGVDLVIPDASYLLDKKDRIRGILITHGHEDHVGGLPYILPMLDFPPMYATLLTHGLINVKLKEHRLLDKTSVTVIAPGDQVELGSCFAEFFRVNHSIPDAVGVVIHTPIGAVVHTGDYKFDYTPVDGKPADLGVLGKIGNEGVLVMMGDSTRVESPGYTPSERVINDSLDKIFANAPGRILLATFASLISRVQQVVDTAIRYERFIALVGRSMQNNVQMAIELGYLTMPKGMLIRVEDINKFHPDQVVIICTGSQGEPTSALTRIANQDHRLVSIQPGDTVILSATPVPGNEKSVHRTINRLFRQGAEVFYQGISNVHVSGHGAQEELKLMLSLIRPKFFMPVHGEYRQLVLHAKLGFSMGIPEKNIVVAEDGDVVELTTDRIGLVGHIASGNVFVDGLSVGDVGQIVLRDRKVLSQDGILMAVLTIDKETGQPVAGPDIVSRGFVYMRDAEELLEAARMRVLASFEHMQPRLSEHSGSDWSFVKDKIKHTLSEFLYEQTRRRPMIIPVVMEV